MSIHRGCVQKLNTAPVLLGCVEYIAGNLPAVFRCGPGPLSDLEFPRKSQRRHRRQSARRAAGGASQCGRSREGLARQGLPGFMNKGSAHLCIWKIAGTQQIAAFPSGIPIDHFLPLQIAARMERHGTLKTTFQFFKLECSFIFFHPP